MADNGYKPGEMDVSEQEKTFGAFVTWSIRVIILCVAAILFLAIFAS
ncbi:MAG: aa3-type cytochrome c oxidase subunit IV [Pseudomonadota bacterium]